ncbi:MAG: integration host factor subunit alpha [Desulfobacteraceae bacterium]|nr:integration host factor subunit alpha [Desulfobacteraceae bacterium]
MEFERMTITKAHITDSIRKGLGMPKSRSFELLKSLFEIMKSNLASGDDILISGFGKFCVKDKNDRRGRNPSTGEDMMLEARRVVTFKCSLPLKQKLNGKH